MSAAAGFWSHSHIQYTIALIDPSASFGAIADDLVSVVLFSMFSLVQGYICSQIYQSLILSKSSRNTLTPPTAKGSNAFTYASIALFFVYLIAAVLHLTAFASKLSTAARIVAKPTQALVVQSIPATSICIPDSINTDRCQWVEVAIAKKNFILDTIMGCFLQVVILVADGLLVYRCYIIYQDKWIVYWCSVFAYLLSFAFFIVSLASISQAIKDWANPDAGLGSGSFILDVLVVVGVGCSVVVNLIVTSAIVFRLLQAKYTFKNLTRVNDRPLQNTYTTAVSILLEAALPPAVLGVIICVMTIPLNNSGITDTNSVRILWISCTALAPQLIVLRVVEGRSWDRNLAMESQASQSQPMAFAPNVTIGSSVETSSRTMSNYGPGSP